MTTEEPQIDWSQFPPIKGPWKPASDVSYEVDRTQFPTDHFRRYAVSNPDLANRLLGLAPIRLMYHSRTAKTIARRQTTFGSW